MADDNTLEQIIRLASLALDVQNTQAYRDLVLDELPRGYPEVLERIILAIARRMEDSGHPRGEALKTAIDCAEEIRHDLAGTTIYIPQRNREGDDSRRDARIYDEFNGHNHAELARKYRITEQWVYAIVRRKRAMLRRSE